jgi:hypothetical protein
MDFEKIKATLPETLRNSGLFGSVRRVNHLIAEIERLRKIEDAALEWHRANPHETEDAAEALGDAIDFNPRPESDT